MSIESVTSGYIDFSSAEQDASLASENDVVQFKAFLSESAENIPENEIVTTLQKIQQSFSSTLEPVGNISNITPDNAVAMQYKLAQASSGVDLIAKVAGGFSQAINKLVTMQ
ncbi:EscI/YscI/HrpB family type III secretion system inner rod protein [Salmonella enterica subsp. enterica]|nr:EscI/YscI/HrpB family type III secretion system inner rod protein [Salmonella enterica subsp. enterica serovar Bonn]EBZ5939312.1 EscI/YscI/HrpB family type III secretion system inner rod protein [Salmonella enterica subsp. enterica serovar Muenchen]MLZ41055.1 EscI/YscI/HrpB family type III secretion system inner rod protein [Salmonella enterica subsp. enterica serovar Bonn]